QTLFGMFITHDMLLDLLTSINNSFAQSMDIEETLKTGVDHIKNYLQSEAASLFLLENNNTDLICKSCSGPVDITGMRLDPGQGVVGYSIKEGQTIVIHDVNNDSRFASVVDKETGFKTESILCAPLNVHGRTIGAIEVLNKHGSGIFAGYDQVVLTALASATAMAIENVRQAEEIAESKNRLSELLLNIATTANHSHTIEGVFQIVLDEICNYSGWLMGHVCIQSMDGSLHLGSSGVWHIPEGGGYETFQREMDSVKVKPDEGLMGKVWKSGASEWVDNIPENKEYTWPKAVQDCDLQSALCYPISAGVEMAATLMFYSDKKMTPKKELLNILEQAVLVVEQAYARTNIEDSIRIALVNAERANLSKNEFLANMSHELRTPLNAILGYSQMMESEISENFDSSSYREYAGYIKASGDILLGHVDRILDATEISSSDSELKEESLNIAKQLSKCVESLDYQTRQNNIKIVSDVAEGTPRLLADKKYFRQIIVNLLLNAIKYNRNGGIVALKADVTDNGEICVLVRDTGQGIEEEAIPHVLENFGRMSPSQISSNEGLGLGLTIVQIVAKLHQADFQLQSEHGLGTTATITFPKERAVCN
ncbi:MAG: GAF domain-containing protein, partial [Rhodospirillales bacterium]|nr:GAF domain-containing protein [Rhodospirillales bacterium]